MPRSGCGCGCECGCEGVWVLSNEFSNAGTSDLMPVIRLRRTKPTELMPRSGCGSGCECECECECGCECGCGGGGVRVLGYEF
jgi:hypothetical protein